MDDEEAVSMFPLMNETRCTDLLRAHGYSMEEVHNWMNSPTPWLSGGIPSLMIQSEPLRVLTAIRRTVSMPGRHRRHDHDLMDDRRCCTPCDWHASPHAGCFLR